MKVLAHALPMSLCLLISTTISTIAGSVSVQTEHHFKPLAKSAPLPGLAHYEYFWTKYGDCFVQGPDGTHEAARYECNRNVGYTLAWTKFGDCAE